MVDPSPSILSASAAIAVRATYESLDRVLARTRTAIVADIGSVKETSDGQIYRSLAFAATPIETLFGEELASRHLDCRYQQGLIHRRGDLVVAPLISGSGMEFGIKTGDRVILLIAADANVPAACKVLRIEPIERRKAIEQPNTKR